jgi:hypothetical protein
LKLSAADINALIGLLGVLREHLLSAIESCTPPAGRKNSATAEERRWVAADRRLVREAERLTEKLVVMLPAAGTVAKKAGGAR